jgi:hypothetical protein
VLVHLRLKGALTEPPIPRTSMPSGNSPRPFAQRFTSWLLEEEVGTAAGRSCHRHVGKVAAVGTHKLIKSFDAIVSAGMAITVDDDEASAPDDDGRQSGGIAVPPLAYLLLLGTRLFLPAD